MTDGSMDLTVVKQEFPEMYEDTRFSEIVDNTSLSNMRQLTQQTRMAPRLTENDKTLGQHQPMSLDNGGAVNVAKSTKDSLVPENVISAIEIRKKPCLISADCQSQNVEAALEHEQISEKYLGDAVSCASHTFHGMDKMETGYLSKGHHTTISVDRCSNRQNKTLSEGEQLVRQDCSSHFFMAGNPVCPKRRHKMEMSYTCHCGISFTQSGCQKKQKRINTGIKSYTCNDCGAVLSKNVYLKYMRTHIAEKSDMSFMGVYSSSYNIRTHTEENPNICEIDVDDSGTSFTEDDNPDNNTEKDTEVPYVCDDYVDDTSFAKDGNSSCHMETHTDETFYIGGDCDIEFSEADILTYHRRMPTRKRSHKCEDCGASFSQSSGLRNHKRTHTGEKPYRCDDCGASFSQSSSLINHKRTHTGEKPYRCGDCGACFAQCGQLTCHKRTHTGEKPYKCDDCGASFTEAGSLKKHSRTHTGERPYKCDDCGALFSQSGSLCKHRRTHTGEKPYKCDDCGASFSEAGSLNKHSKIHTGLKPYRCDDCSASFSRIDILKNHKRTHTGEKPYKCDYCGTSYSQLGHLKNHRRTHTGEKPYICNHCDACFSQSSQLKSHKRKHIVVKLYKHDFYAVSA